jgi:predicted SprT family Zn-dependent metalloprotease
MPKRSRKRKVAIPELPMQRQLALPFEGRHFNLQEIFKSLNERYFGGKFRRYNIGWGRRRKEKPKNYFVFGTIQEEDRVIRIHPLLDAPFVPKWFLEYIVYHEMCHAVVPDEIYPSGRRKVHTDDFFRREKKFRFYRRARQWEKENLGRFLQ